MACASTIWTTIYAWQMNEILPFDMGVAIAPERAADTGWRASTTPLTDKKV
jgi:hypothetical protein